jgi:hypothetical protein
VKLTLMEMAKLIMKVRDPLLSPPHLLTNTFLTFFHDEEFVKVR